MRLAEQWKDIQQCWGLILKMGMIGFGSKLNQTIKKFEAGMPFSVKANFMEWHNQTKGLAISGVYDFTLSNSEFEVFGDQNDNPMPCGGKILMIRAYANRSNSDNSYFVPMKNGVEQTDLKCEIINPVIGTLYDSPAGNEIEFSKGDYIGWRHKSVGTAIAFDDYVLFIIYAFNIGEDDP